MTDHPSVANHEADTPAYSQPDTITEPTIIKTEDLLPYAAKVWADRDKAAFNPQRPADRPLREFDNHFRKLADAISLRGLGVTGKTGAEIKSVEHLGSLIRAQRRRIGLSQAELACRAAVGRRLVVELEGGKETVRSTEMLRVCAAAGLQLSVRTSQGADEFSR